MEEILVHAGAVLLYIFLFSCLILTVFGLGGNWIIALSALVVTITGWGELTWGWLFLIVGLAVLGEIVEALLGLVIVAKKGGTRWGVLGSFVGGIAGVIIGGPIVPPLGSLVFAFIGAFAGGAVGEYLNDRRVEEAMRVGLWSFVGRSMAAAAKVAIGFSMVWIVVVRTW